MKEQSKTTRKKDNQEQQPQTHGNAGPPVITVDYERYAHFLENADLTEDQKREFLQALWNIIVEFVSLGFGVHPLQQAQEPCGKLDQAPAYPALTAPDRVYLDKSILNQFIEVTDLETDAGLEGVEG